MTLISAFADEISSDLDEQIALLRDLGIEYLELRSVWDTNVLDLSDEQVALVATALRGAGMTVSSIGSPIGKTPIDGPFDEVLRQFDRALELAQSFGAEYVRLFSFYPPERDGPSRRTARSGDGLTVDPERYREEVIGRMRALTRRARDTAVVLLHENEKDIYGDTAARCVDLLASVDDPQFRAAFDPANFIQCGEVPYPDAYEVLRPWIAYVHVKDARLDGTVTASGEGITRWPELLVQLRADGYDSFFSLEPHLSSSGRFKGFSGPELFRYAARRFQGLTASVS